MEAGEAAGMCGGVSWRSPSLKVSSTHLEFFFFFYPRLSQENIATAFQRGDGISGERNTERESMVRPPAGRESAIHFHRGCLDYLHRYCLEYLYQWRYSRQRLYTLP